MGVQDYRADCALKRFPANGNIDEYIKVLETLGVEYFEVNTIKPNGRKFRLVVPVQKMRKMNKTAVNKLLNGVF